MLNRMNRIDNEIAALHEEMARQEKSGAKKQTRSFVSNITPRQRRITQTMTS